MAKEQLTVGHRAAVEAVGASAAGWAKGRGWGWSGRWGGHRILPMVDRSRPIFTALLEELLEPLVGAIDLDEKIAAGLVGQGMGTAQPVRMGFFGPAAVGAFQAGWLEIGEKVLRNMEIFTKENMAGLDQLLFGSGGIHTVIKGYVGQSWSQSGQGGSAGAFSGCRWSVSCTGAVLRRQSAAGVKSCAPHRV